MKKNNKGFTLVELLAALVILGVLSLLALPTVINLLGNSRDKLYVTDAKKLISQAEYKFRVASSEIEKPDDGECLVLSMIYLDNSDFDNPPNNGEYVREASYVVIKNNSGNYEFAVQLVEEVNENSFKGVELTRDIDLDTNSTKHVVSFKKDGLYFVESNTVMGKYNGSQIDVEYINSKLGNDYVSGITDVYNYPDLADDTYNENYEIPKISSISISTASNKDFNSLDAILKVVATDVDTPTNNLLVYVSPGRVAPDIATAVDCDASQSYTFQQCRYQYGSLSEFSLNVDFSQNGYDYGDDTEKDAYLYVTVVDPEGNSDSLNPVYTIHTNVAPVIDVSRSGVFKRSTDGMNLATAVLRLHVSDDSTPIRDLEYCLTEEKDATSCEGYQKYSNFNNNSELEYTFSCASNNSCDYINGTELNLTVFVRDDDSTSPKSTNAQFTYKLFKNDVPVITEFTLQSDVLSFVDVNSSALKAFVNLVVSDASASNKIDVVLDEDPNFNKNPVEYKYSDFAGGNISYTFSGIYDGLERVLYVRVTDEYNASVEANYNYGNVHANAKPVITDIILTSANLEEKVCPNSKICTQYSDETGGAYELSVKVEVTDDFVEAGLAQKSDLFICISPTASDCTDISTGKFFLYNPDESKVINLTELDSSKPYKGDVHKIYVSVYDNYGVASDGSYNYSQYSLLGEKDYKIYTNHPPLIEKDQILVTSNNPDYNFKDVTISFTVNDDLDNLTDLTYKIYDNIQGDRNIVTGNITATSFEESMEIPYTFDEDYDGAKRYLTIIITDTYGAETVIENVEYQMHDNKAPEIGSINIVSNEKPCDLNECNNSVKTKVSFSVTDDLTTDLENLDLCVSLSSTTCDSYNKIKNYTGYEYSNGTFSFLYEFSNGDFPYKGETKTLYLYVKDSYQDVGKKSANYTFYNNTKASIDVSYPVVKSTNYEEANGEEFAANKNPNLSTFTFSIKAADEFVGTSKLRYQVCYVPNLDVGVEEATNVKCLEDNKFYDYGDDPVSTQNLDLGVRSYTGQSYYLFAKVYDDYAYGCATNKISSSICNNNKGYISYSSTVYYQLYTDIDPTINTFTAVRPSDTSSYETLNVTLAVEDTLDTFKYCISESETECTNYTSDSYPGDGAVITTTYNPSWGTTYVPNRVFSIYLHVKDSHGKVVTASAFPDRVPCDSTFDTETGELIESAVDQDPVVYELNSGSSEITAAKCNRKCYYWEEAEINGLTVGPSDTKNIVSYYTRTITYRDKEDNTIVCSKDIDSNYAAHCNHKGCYYNAIANNYKVLAIGYIEHSNSDSSFVHTIGRDSHIPSHYRNEYITHYDAINDLIVLNATGNKVCGQCFNEGIYEGIRITYDNNLG